MSTPINELFVAPAAPPKPSSEVEEVEEIEARPAKRARAVASRVDSAMAPSRLVEHRVGELETRVARLDGRAPLDPEAPSTEVGWRSVMMTEIWQTLAGGPVSNQLTRAELSALWKIAGTLRVAEDRRALAFNAFGEAYIEMLRVGKTCVGCDLNPSGDSNRDYDTVGLCGGCNDAAVELKFIVDRLAEARAKSQCLPPRFFARIERFVGRPQPLWVNLGTLVPPRP